MMLGQASQIIVAEVEVGQLVKTGERVLVDTLEIVGAQEELVEVGYAVEVVLGDDLQPVHGNIQCHQFPCPV